MNEIKHSKEINFQVVEISDDLEEDGWISALGEEDEEHGGSCQIKQTTKKEELGGSQIETKTKNRGFGGGQIKTSKIQIKSDATPASSSSTHNKVLTQIYICEKSLIGIGFDTKFEKERRWEAVGGSQVSSAVLRTGSVCCSSSPHLWFFEILIVHLEIIWSFEAFGI